MLTKSLVATLGFWDVCEEGDIHDSVIDGSLNAGEYGRLELEVNGVMVSETVCLHRCCALRHEDTDQALSYRWTPNAQDQYEVKAQITDATKYAYARFSSFIAL